MDFINGTYYALTCASDSSGTARATHEAGAPFRSTLEVCQSQVRARLGASRRVRHANIRRILLLVRVKHVGGDFAVAVTRPGSWKEAARFVTGNIEDESLTIRKR